MSVTYAPRSERIELLLANVREIEDFPRKGIFTQDVSKLFQDPHLLRILITELTALVGHLHFDVIAGIYSRGYMLGPALASACDKPFLPIPKSVGSPSAMREKYTYEYSADALELEPGALAPGTRVLLVDDQIATGGTVLAAIRLIERSGANVAGCAFILTQTRHEGLAKLAAYPTVALFEKNPSR